MTTIWLRSVAARRIVGPDDLFVHKVGEKGSLLHSFEEIGVYPYTDSIHASMKGAITVVGM